MRSTTGAKKRARRTTGAKKRAAAAAEHLRWTRVMGDGDAVGMHWHRDRWCLDNIMVRRHGGSPVQVRVQCSAARPRFGYAREGEQ